MYLALFLTPWVLMYAVSTLAMNHHHFFENWYNHEPVSWTLVEERPYPVEFPSETKRWMVAEQILNDLNINGAHNVGGNLDKEIIITRRNAIVPQRITYNPKAQTLRIENQAFRTNAFLEQMHRRRGYETKYWTDDLWAFTVDIFIVGTVVWALSGLWMWWELKNTRKWGTVCMGSGVIIFAFFLFTI